MVELYKGIIILLSVTLAFMVGLMLYMGQSSIRRMEKRRKEAEITDRLDEIRDLLELYLLKDEEAR